MKYTRARRFFTPRISVLLLIVHVGGGCCSYTLTRPPDWQSVVRPRPIVVALSAISDSVECDDETVYVQEYLEGLNIFYDSVLADPDRPKDYHDADVVITGAITAAVGSPKMLGPGLFASVMSGGVYCLLAGPFRHRETTVNYKFEVLYADLALTRSYEFTDARNATYGAYEPPLAMEKKPDLYRAGWDQLLYEICKELAAQEAASQ